MSRRTTVRRRAALPLAAVVVALAGFASAQRFSRADVERAFERHGVRLVVADERFDFGQEVILAPRTRERLLVLVYEHGWDARKGMGTLTIQRSRPSFDRRVANVVVTSDDALVSCVIN